MTTTGRSLSHHITPLSPDVAPGLAAPARQIQRGEWEVGAAAAPLRDLDRVFHPAGFAWGDAAFARELRDSHRRLEASESSLASLASLADGSAGCVITGQQPGLLGGPLYCAYKIAGAVALARALSERSGSRVVPVFWCGADDSDFEEVRRIWLWSQANEPFRGELPSSLWQEGARVGSLGGAELDAVVKGMLDHAGAAPGARELRASLAGADDLDFGQRMAAFYLRRFGADGLVIVDARSRRLRELGKDLFHEYARGHQELTRRLGQRTDELASEGRATPLTARAMETGLFRLEGEIRSKLTPADLAAGVGPLDLAPSVLLRPLWQDHLLGPVAAVLGPAELAYHAQIAPLYPALGVRGARPVARPHVTLWPGRLPWPEDPEVQRRVLAGGHDSRRALSALAAVPAWSAAFDAARSAVERAMHDLAGALDDATARSSLVRGRERLLDEIRRLEAELEEPVLERRAREDSTWRWAHRWLAIRGVPQERALAAGTAWWAWGEAFRATLDDLGRHYVIAVERGAPTTFLAREAL